MSRLLASLVFGLASFLGCVAHFADTPQLVFGIEGGQFFVCHHFNEQQHVHDKWVGRRNEDVTLHSFSLFFEEFDLLRPIIHRGLNGDLPQMPAVVINPVQLVPMIFGSAVEPSDGSTRGGANHTAGQREYSERDWIDVHPWIVGVFVLLGVTVGGLIVPLTLWLSIRVRESKRERVTGYAGGAQ